MSSAEVMLHHDQFMPHISVAAHERPLQQSSPSDNSMSTGTPPHQISRASPASTALVMSNNNIAAVAPSSRQLTPHSNGSSSAEGNSTNSSSSSGNRNGDGNNNDNSSGHPHHQGGAPNPMIRQFACHTKSMSAGVVVPVPGISNSLASATGMNQNNMISNTLTQQQHQQHQQHQHHQHHQNQMHHQRQMSTHSTRHHQQQQHHPNSMHHNQQGPNKQVIREHRTHHHRSISHQNRQVQQAHEAAAAAGGGQQFGAGTTGHSAIGSSQNLVDARTGSSIVLSTNNLSTNIHHRSASTQLSNIIMGATNQHPVVAQRQRTGQHQHQDPYPAHVTNSIWSIDENISKSQGKLTGSGYLAHTYLYNPSITDLSCDNVSNASRLLAASEAGGPAPGYYLHSGNSAGQNAANANGGAQQPLAAHHNSQALSASGATLKQPEFLPICDLMFNLTSMIVYFCENVFGVIALIALYYHASSKYWALIGAAFMFASNFICQYLSLRWLYKMKLDECRRKREAQEELEDEEECERQRYYNRNKSLHSYPCGSCTWLPDGATEVQLKFLLSIALDAIIHIFCLGFLVRYIKLVIPVSDTSRVKREARDLCMLRMIHGFVQSAPLLLLQSYMVCSLGYGTSIVNLSTTSVVLSLVNVCWAQASFTKYARKKYMHKFVLTWLGILCQLLWRLGMISSRVAALTIYAVYYGYWMLVVVSLHWITMFMWHLKPGNFLRDELDLSRGKRLSLAAGAAWIYCFDYMNFEEHNSIAKMIAFYLIMFLENNLLFTVSLTLSAQVTWFKSTSILVVYLGFAFGLLFMFVYYKYFHVTVLNNGLSCSQDSIDSIADQLTSAGKKVAGFKPGTLRLKSEDSLTSVGRKYNGNMGANLRAGSHPETSRSEKPPYLTSSATNTSNHHHHHHHQHLGVRAAQMGIFSCKPMLGVKKQKLPQVRRHQQ